LSGEFLNIPDENSSTRTLLNESLIQDDVVLKMPIPDFLSKPLVNKKLEKVKGLHAGKATKTKDLEKKKITGATTKVSARKLGFEESTTTYGFLQSLDGKL
jgi:hypothetical protein